MIALEREVSLRVEAGTPVEIACLSGVVWVTHESDLRDLFLAPGESLLSPLRGVTLVTALEPATVRVLDRAAQTRPLLRWWGYVVGAVRGLRPWRRPDVRTARIIRPSSAVAG